MVLVSLLRMELEFSLYGVALLGYFVCRLFGCRIVGLCGSFIGMLSASSCCCVVGIMLCLICVCLVIVVVGMRTVVL